jgi:hypothetical protein
MKTNSKEPSASISQQHMERKMDENNLCEPCTSIPQIYFLEPLCSLRAWESALMNMVLRTMGKQHE